jgi:hypothetical protein
MEGREVQCQYLREETWCKSLKQFQDKTEFLIRAGTEEQEKLAKHRMIFQAYLIKLFDEGKIVYV